METVETKNSKLWLILAIVFGVLIPLPMLPSVELYYYYVVYTSIVGSLYSWIILPRVKKWYIFVLVLPSFMTITQIPVALSSFIVVGAFIWSFYWFFVPCVRFIKNRAFRNFCCIVFLIFTLAVVIPIELILLDILHWDFASTEWSLNLNPKNWNLWFLPGK